MAQQTRVIHWFRQDLRLSDNPAFYDATMHGEVLPIYILDDDNAGAYKMGGASRIWLHHSLVSLNNSLSQRLVLYRGNPLLILSRLCSQYNIKQVFWNRCYEPWRISRDTKIKEQLISDGVEVNSYNGSLLWEPWAIKKSDGTSYKVFTAFYRNGCLGAQAPRKPLPRPEVNFFSDYIQGDLTIDDLNLLPNKKWYNKIEKYWSFGEKAAEDSLFNFLETGLSDYKEGRNYPARQCVSKLSPHLHLGEISPNQVWHMIKQYGDNQDTDSFCSELAWREFSYNLLYNNPDMPEKNLQSRFDNFPWADTQDKLLAWQHGRTGVPMVDAGMRELWETGYMHNRVRMIVGSFLVKNLLLHWKHGERWFWDCLVDADLANNSASWQWVAGCGADAAPYFRIFNPVSQGEKFDPDGKYIRQYVPELRKLPDKYIFSPWEAPQSILDMAGVKLGGNYPQPIVDIQSSRKLALDSFISLKNSCKVNPECVK